MGGANAYLPEVTKRKKVATLRGAGPRHQSDVRSCHYQRMCRGGMCLVRIWEGNCVHLYYKVLQFQVLLEVLDSLGRCP